MAVSKDMVDDIHISHTKQIIKNTSIQGQNEELFSFVMFCSHNQPFCLIFKELPLIADFFFNLFNIVFYLISNSFWSHFWVGFSYNHILASSKRGFLDYFQQERGQNGTIHEKKVVALNVFLRALTILRRLLLLLF